MSGLIGRHSRHLFAALLLGASALASGTALAQDYTVRVGHLESTEQSRHIHLEKVAALVKERTNGAVEFQIFPQSQLGNQRQMTESVQFGALEATVAPAAFLGGFNPLISVLDIPYLLPTDEAEAQALREGPFGQALLDSFTSRGLVALMLWPNGRKSFTSNEPLDSVEAFHDQKFRVMDSRVLIEQFTALGASAIALPFGELYTALQTGVVDGEENPADTILRMKFHEVQKHMLVSDHGAMEDVVLFSPMFWQSLPQEHKDVIVAAFKEVIPELTAHKKAAMEAAVQEISATDIDVRTITDEERTALREAMYEPAKAAFVSFAGDEGQKLIELYEAETAK